MDSPTIAPPVTLSGLIREMDDGSPDVAERVVMRVLDEFPNLAAELLLPSVRSDVSRARRAAARNSEDRAWGQGRGPWPPNTGDEPPFDPVAARRELLRTSFFDVTTDRLVPWGEATIMQHLARAQYMRIRAERILEDASRHEEAAQRILDAQHLDSSVRCLNDLE